MPRQNHYPKVIGVRLSPEDTAKLHRLCTHTHRPASELVRLLIRTAQPVDLVPFQFRAAPVQDVGHG